MVEIGQIHREKGHCSSSRKQCFRIVYDLKHKANDLNDENIFEIWLDYSHLSGMHDKFINGLESQFAHQNSMIICGTFWSYI